MRWIVEIAIGAALVVADLPAHALGEDLGAAAGQRIEPGVHQLAQHLLVASCRRDRRRYAISTAVKHFR